MVLGEDILDDQLELHCLPFLLFLLGVQVTGLPIIQVEFLKVLYDPSSADLHELLVLQGFIVLYLEFPQEEVALAVLLDEFL